MIVYIVCLGVGVAGLIAYNIWNNRDLQKARQRRCRDSLMDDLNGEKMWRNSKWTTLSSTLPVDNYDSQVGPKPEVSKVSFEDSLASIDSLGDAEDSLSTVRSEKRHDSRAASPHNLAAMSHSDENGHPRASKGSLAFSGLDVSALTDSDIESVIGDSVSLDTSYRKHKSNRTSFQHVETAGARAKAMVKGTEGIDFQVTGSAQALTSTDKLSREARKRNSSIYSQDSLDADLWKYLGELE